MCVRTLFSYEEDLMTHTEAGLAVTRQIDGAELPAPGRWQIDPGHTELAFIGRHFMLTKVRGRFTGHEARDEHLRSADFFDVEHYPAATFSARASGWQGTRGPLAGELTLHGITRPVTLQAEYLGYTADPWGGHRVVFSAAGTVNREDWGLTWNLPLDGGGLVVSREIRIEIELEAVLQA
jgi:polyisoprenoid-binding protein YceI